MPTRRVWLRQLTRTWFIGSLGYLVGILLSWPALFWWVLCGVFFLLGIVQLVVLLLWRRADAHRDMAVQRHMDAALPPVPTPAEIAAQQKEREQR